MAEIAGPDQVTGNPDKDLSQELRSVEAQLAAEKQKISSLGQRLNALSLLQEKAVAKRNEVLRDPQSTDGDVRAARNRITNFDKNLQETDKELQKAQAELARLEQEKIALQAQIESSNNAEPAQSQLQEKSLDQRILESKIAALPNTIAELTTKIIILKNEQYGLRSQRETALSSARTLLTKRVDERYETYENHTLINPNKLGVSAKESYDAYLNTAATLQEAIDSHDLLIAAAEEKKAGLVAVEQEAERVRTEETAAQKAAAEARQAEQAVAEARKAEQQAAARALSSNAAPARSPVPEAPLKKPISVDRTATSKQNYDVQQLPFVTEEQQKQALAFREAMDAATAATDVAAVLRNMKASGKKELIVQLNRSWTPPFRMQYAQMDITALQKIAHEADSLTPKQKEAVQKLPKWLQDKLQSK